MCSINKTWRFTGFYFRPQHIICKLITSKEAHQSVLVPFFSPLPQDVGFYKPHRFYPSTSPLPQIPTLSQNHLTLSKAGGLDLDILCLLPLFCFFPECIAKSVPFVSIFPIPWSLHLFPSNLINSYMKRATQYVCFRKISVVCAHSRQSTGNWTKTRLKWIARWTLYENTSSFGTSAWSLLESTVLFVPESHTNTHHVLH